MMKRILPLLLVFMMGAVAVQAQSMSDEQVIEYVKSATSAGKSQKQIMTELAARGVTRAQAERIKKRYEEQQMSEQGMGAIAKNRQRTNLNAPKQLVEGEMDLMAAEMSNPTEQSTDVAAQLVYGRNIFNSRNLTFAPSQNIPTPINYQLAAGDEVIIDVWGNNQATYRETITPEGNINIPNLGPIYLNGLTVKEAEKEHIMLAEKLIMSEKPSANSVIINAFLSLKKLRSSPTASNLTTGISHFSINWKFNASKPQGDGRKANFNGLLILR